MVLNILKCFHEKIRHENSYTIFCPKMFQYLHIVCLVMHDADFYNLSVKISSISFFSSSDTQKFHHLLGCQAIGINSSLIVFLSALHFSNYICLTKKLS